MRLEFGTRSGLVQTALVITGLSAVGVLFVSIGLLFLASDSPGAAMALGGLMSLTFYGLSLALLVWLAVALRGLRRCLQSGLAGRAPRT